MFYKLKADGYKRCEEHYDMRRDSILSNKDVVLNKTIKISAPSIDDAVNLVIEQCKTEVPCLDYLEISLWKVIAIGEEEEIE